MMMATNTQGDSPFQHDYPFDPSYGYDLQDLLAVKPPPEPEGFAEIWQQRYRAALAIDPAPRLARGRDRHADYHCLDIEYSSTDGFPIRGWLLMPKRIKPTRAIVCGHGYGGIEPADVDFPLEDAIYLIPCFRGLCRSTRATISDDPWWHVLHDLDKPDRYILRGCVEDLWTGVSVLLALFPWLEGHIGYMGISFGGGIGAMALAWDQRIARGHLNIPTFGHQQIRLDLETTGSGESVRLFAQQHPQASVTLSGYDAAIAAKHIQQPMHLALALFDPVVPPPGQFAIHNAIPGEKRLLVLRAGHFDYPEQAQQQSEVLNELADFFGALGD